MQIVSREMRRRDAIITSSSHLHVSDCFVEADVENENVTQMSSPWFCLLPLTILKMAFDY